MRKIFGKLKNCWNLNNLLEHTRLQFHSCAEQFHLFDVFYWVTQLFHNDFHLNRNCGFFSCIFIYFVNAYIPSVIAIQLTSVCIFTIQTIPLHLLFLWNAFWWHFMFSLFTTFLWKIHLNQHTLATWDNRNIFPHVLIEFFFFLFILSFLHSLYWWRKCFVESFE